MGNLQLDLSSISNDGFFSNMFSIPKKTGGWRLINLKRLNEFIAYKHFKMEGLEWGVEILVPLAPDHCRFLGFCWKGKLWVYVSWRSSHGPKIVINFLKFLGFIINYKKRLLFPNKF